MRIEFKMTDKQLDRLLDACQPVPYLIAGGHAPPTQQALANGAWNALGKEMGFDGSTVKPYPGRGQRHFLAEPLEELSDE